jgi:hypothetical protein
MNSKQTMGLKSDIKKFNKNEIKKIYITNQKNYN